VKKKEQIVGKGIDKGKQADNLNVKFSFDCAGVVLSKVVHQVDSPKKLNPARERNFAQKRVYLTTIGTYLRVRTDDRMNEIGR
jgi:hypothetical protein